MSLKQAKEVTPEQREAAKRATEEMLKKMDEEREKIKNDPVGIDTLALASKQVNQTKSLSPKHSSKYASVLSVY